MKRVFLILLMTVLTVTLIFGGCSAPASAPTPKSAPVPAPSPSPSASPAPVPLSSPTPKPVSKPSTKPVELRLVAGIPRSSSTNIPLWMVIERLNKRSNGEFTIKYLGGPEVIGTSDQAMAVKMGVVDLAYAFTSSYAGLIPGVKAFGLSNITAAEERKRGFVDYIQTLYQKAGLRYLGRGEIADGVTTRVQCIFVNRKIDKPQQMAGMKIAVPSPLINSFLKELKASPVQMSYEDMYSALDTGLVQGYFTVMATAVASGLQEVTKFYIDHPFYKTTMTFIANPANWNQLPKNLQDLLESVIIEIENEGPAAFKEAMAGDLKKMTDAGVKIIKFSPEDAEWFVKLAYDAEWADEMKRSPEITGKYKELLVK